jgi:hypothetical protein
VEVLLRLVAFWANKLVTFNESIEEVEANKFVAEAFVAKRLVVVVFSPVALVHVKFVTENKLAKRFVKVALVPVTSVRTNPFPEAFEKLRVVANKSVEDTVSA